MATSEDEMHAAVVLEIDAALKCHYFLNHCEKSLREVLPTTPNATKKLWHGDITGHLLGQSDNKDCCLNAVFKMNWKFLFTNLNSVKLYNLKWE